MFTCTSTNSFALLWLKPTCNDGIQRGIAISGRMSEACGRGRTDVEAFRERFEEYHHRDDWFFLVPPVSAFIDALPDAKTRAALWNWEEIAHSTPDSMLKPPPRA